MLDLESLTALVNDWFVKQPEIPGGTSVVITIQGNDASVAANATQPTDKLMMKVSDFFYERLPQNATTLRIYRHLGGQYENEFTDMTMAVFLQKVSLAELLRLRNVGQRSIKTVVDALAQEGWSLKTR